MDNSITALEVISLICIVFLGIFIFGLWLGYRRYAEFERKLNDIIEDDET